MSAYDDALDRVRAYAQKISEGERAADRESLDRAADLAMLYEDKRWIEEEAAAGRAPKTKVHNGRPVDPAAQHRFGTWLYHKGELGPRQTTKLLKAHDWVQSYSSTRRISALAGENTIRPLYELGRKGYGSDTPKVLARAQEIAGDGMPVTSSHTKQALREFWASIPKPARARTETIHKAEQMRKKAIADIDALIELGAYGDAQQVLREAAEHLRRAHKTRKKAA
jgi:hypothetical protein